MLVLHIKTSNDVKMAITLDAGYVVIAEPYRREDPRSETSNGRVTIGTLESEAIIKTIDEVLDASVDDDYIL